MSEVKEKIYKPLEDAQRARTVVLTTQRSKEAYQAYCEAIGETVSDHLRNTMEAEVALWEASKKK